MEAPTRESITALIDAEIADIRNDQSRPGWTPWAIAAAGAAIGWQLLAMPIEALIKDPAFHRALIAVLLLSDAVFILKRATRLIAGGPCRETRFLPMDALRPALRQSVYLAVRSGLLLALFCTGSSPAGWLTVVGMLYAGFIVLLCSAVAVMATLPLKLFTPDDTGGASGTAAKVYGVIALVLLAIPVVVNSRVAWSDLPESRESLKGAVAVGGLFWLIFTALSEEPVSATLPALVAIRRDLAMGLVDPDTAAKKIDLALLGYKTSDVLASETKTFLELIAQFKVSIAIVDQKLNEAESLLSNQAEQAHLAGAGAILLHARQSVTAMELQSSAVATERNKVQRALGHLLSNGGAPGPIASARAHLNSESQTLHARISNIGARLNLLEQRSILLISSTGGRSKSDTTAAFDQN